MPPENVIRIRELFEEAVALDGPRRVAFLLRECGADNDLKRRVEELIAASQSDDRFLVDPTADIPSSRHGNIGPSAIAQARLDAIQAYDPAIELSGASVGPYRILQKIGEGGFGTVYMAEQEQPVRRRAALKIIKLGMDTKQVIARFEAER